MVAGRVSGSTMNAQISTTPLNTREEQENRFPAEGGVENAADQRRDHRRDHHRGGDQADHGGGAVALDTDRG